MVDLKRIERELRHCKNLSKDGVKVETVNDSLINLVGTFIGPEDTPYKGSNTSQ